MANDIATHTAGLLQKFSETLDRINDIQSVECDNNHIEGAEAAWMLRSHFLHIASEQWKEILEIMRSEILPFVRDLKCAGRH